MVEHQRIFSLTFLALFLYLIVSTSPSYAEEGPTNGKPVLPGEDCQTNSLKSWKPQEKWVWEQVCAGKIANFNLSKSYGGILDPKELEGWSEKRILSPAFLETILLHEPYRGALTRNGVRIVGALFKKPLDLSKATLTHQLLVHASRFESEVNLSYLHALRLLSLDGSKFTGKLNMNSIEVKESLFMRGGDEFGEVDLIGAKIGGNLDMDGSRFAGKLNMDSIEVRGYLSMRKKAEFSEVYLGYAKIEGNLGMTGSRFTGKLNMDSMHVDSSLFMHRGAEFTQPLVLTFAKIGKRIDISGSTLASIDLTGTHIYGEFVLSPPAPQWKEGAKLTLRNAEVGALQDLPWASTLELDGFNYACLGGLSTDDSSRVGALKISRFKEWLEKQTRYSPQPYEQLATVLRKAAYNDKAKAILYEGKKREHWEATNMLSLSWWWLAFQWLFIGYGYRNFRVLIWCVIFCGLGMLALHRSGLDIKNSLKYWGFAYSVDMLLPIIELHRPHYKIILTGGVRVYFYIHKIFGYVLGFFLIAGLSGLTK